MTTRTTRMLRTAAIASALAVGLAACSSPPAEAPSVSSDPASAVTASDAILAPYGLDGLDAREVIDALEAMPLDERPADLMASVRPDELLLAGADGAEVSMPMPTDAFYVSVAPYADSTHECYFHSLTTCTGEMSSAAIDVLVTDAETGEVLVDESSTTTPNGFHGMWLPRDTEVDVTITRDGKTATQRLDTSDPDDATCVTTMQLA